MLFVWLFGFALGVVHACLAPTSADPGGAERSLPAAAGDAAARQLGAEQASHHAGTDGMQDRAHDDSPGCSDCQALCEKSADPIPALVSVPDDLHADALPPSATVLTVAPLAAPPDPLLPTPHRDGAVGPPITIAFLRLAL